MTTTRQDLIKSGVLKPGATPTAAKRKKPLTTVDPRAAAARKLEANLRRVP